MDRGAPDLLRLPSHQVASGSFDYVMVESPPLTRVVDTAVISQLSDRSIFHGCPEAYTARGHSQALKNSSLWRHKIAGVAFNLIDEKSMTSHGCYGCYGGKYMAVTTTRERRRSRVIQADFWAGSLARA